MQRGRIVIIGLAIGLFVGRDVGAGGLPNNPDLLYSPGSGSVQIDADGAVIGSFFLESLNGEFLPPADYSDLDADVGFGTSLQVDNTPNNLGWISIAIAGGVGFDGPSLANLGNIFPTSLDLDGLDALLLESGWSAPTGGGGDFDLILAAGLLADADSDGDVDGTDFLIIQRTNVGLIPQWQTEYGSGTPLVAGVQAVPEPSSLAVGSLVLSMSIACSRYRRLR